MTTTSPARPVQVMVVESPGCHACVEAHRSLADLAARGLPVQVRTIDARSPEGRALMQQHRAGLTPLILLDGAFFSQGRLPTHELERLLQRRTLIQAGVAGPEV